MPDIYKWRFVFHNENVVVIANNPVHSMDKIKIIYKYLHHKECSYDSMQWYPRYNIGYVRNFEGECRYL